MTIAEQYADYATSLEYGDLSADVVAHAKKLILDIIANAIGGHAWMDSGPKILEGVRALNRGRGGATVLATGEQMAPEWAVLANGTFAHSLDYDNHHAKGVIHAGSSVVSSALAAGEENGSSGKDLITAVVIGYEIACRLAMALGPHSSHEMGFHPTGTCATFAVVGDHRAASRIEPRRDTQRDGAQRLASGGLDAVRAQRCLEQARPHRPGRSRRIHRSDPRRQRIHRCCRGLRRHPGLSAGVCPATPAGRGDPNPRKLVRDPGGRHQAVLTVPLHTPDARSAHRSGE